MVSACSKCGKGNTGRVLAQREERCYKHFINIPQVNLNWVLTTQRQSVLSEYRGYNLSPLRVIFKMTNILIWYSS